jgi:hypothetical protein
VNIKTTTTYEITTSDDLVLEIEHQPNARALSIGYRRADEVFCISEFIVAIDRNILSEIEDAFSKMYYAQMAQDEIDEV